MTAPFTSVGRSIGMIFPIKLEFFGEKSPASVLKKFRLPPAAGCYFDRCPSKRVQSSRFDSPVADADLLKK